MSITNSSKTLRVVRTIFSVLIISWPLLFFAEKNMLQSSLSFAYLWFLFVIFLTIFLLIAISIRLLYIVIKQRPEWSLDLLSISVSFTLTLFIFSLQLVPVANLRAELAFMVLSFLLFYTINTVVLRRPNTRKILTTFLAVMILIVCVQIGFKIPVLLVDSPSVANSRDFIGEKFTHKKRSVYYIILDAQTSFDQIEKLRTLFNITDFGEDFRDIQQKLDDALYRVKNSKSSYNMTYLTLKSIFDAGYTVTEKSKRYTHRSGMFPEMMRWSTAPEAILAPNGYKLIWSGNHWGKCTRRIFVCIDNLRDPTLYTRKTVEEYLPILKSATTIFYKFKEKIGINPMSKLKNPENLTQSIHAFYNKLQLQFRFDNNPKFVFVHELVPHDMVGADCGEGLKLNTKDFSRGEMVKLYLASSLCALRSALKAVLEIRKKDSDAIIVLQGDHGSYFTNKGGFSGLFGLDLKDVNIERPDIQERMSILNYISFPADCTLDLSTLTTNVLTAQAAISCALGHKPNLSPALSYWGVYEENPDFGIVKKIVGFRKK
jgi:hypothetical protein